MIAGGIVAFFIVLTIGIAVQSNRISAARAEDKSVQIEKEKMTYITDDYIAERRKNDSEFDTELLDNL